MERLTEPDLMVLRDMWEHDACTAEIDALTDERDTHAETLRVLLLDRARDHARSASVLLSPYRNPRPYEAELVSAAEHRGYAGIALILAALIGGE